MSELNPYEKFLDGRPVETILAETSRSLAGYFEIIGPERAKRSPAPGKWSAAEILCHLADCELVFGFRLRQTLAENSPTIQPFDQDKWAAMYPGVPAALALEVFTALRKWNLELIRRQLPLAADRTMRHPERGTMTFRTVVETIAGHDLNHLGQMKNIAER